MSNLVVVYNCESKVAARDWGVNCRREAKSPFQVNLAIEGVLDLQANCLGSGWGGGGKAYRVNLGGGGKGNVLQSVLAKTTFGGLRNSGWSGRCLFLLREMTESCQKGGRETYRRWGSKNVCGEGFFAEFTVCFPPPWVFHPPWPPSE